MAINTLSGTKTRELVALDLIDDNPWQPRQAIDPDALEELAASIYELGVLQTPLGRRVDTGRVQLAFGHQRVGACRLLRGRGAAGPQVELDLADISDEKMAVIALSENVRRKQLTQIEVVRAHKKAIEETSLIVADLARQLGMDRASLSNNLRVLELPDFVLEHVESGALGLTVAREFLVFQDAGHVHAEDMRKVVDRIARPSPYGWTPDLGPPDWRRRNVRKMICGRVEANEEDWRPLGPRPRYINAGGYREASFDTEAFAAERPQTLHTIPADMAGDGKHEGSRVWTCDVKTWRSWQTRATKEANREEEATGNQREKPAKGVSREKQFEQILASDPVWKKIAVSRETAGPARPVTEEEKTALGTRAEFRDVASHNSGFYKKLQKGNPDDPYDWDRDSGGSVPPWFTDLKECQRCTIGAAYAKSSHGYPIEKATLCCFNRDHYKEKLQVGEADYRAKWEAQKKGSDRRDLKKAEEVLGELSLLSADACKAMATALLSAGPVLELEHPFGIYHKAWSYESAASVKVRELLFVDLSTRGWRGDPAAVLGPEDVERLPPGEVLQLVASLVAYHLRRAGTFDTVSRETEG